MFKAFDCELDVVDIHGFREPASDPRAAACFVCSFEVTEHLSIFTDGGYVKLIISRLKRTTVDT